QRCHQQTGSFSLPFVIFSSCMTFSYHSLSCKVHNPSSHMIQAKDDDCLDSELVRRMPRNPVALRPQRTHIAGSDSVRFRSASVSFISVTMGASLVAASLFPLSPPVRSAPLMRTDPAPACRRRGGSACLRGRGFLAPAISRMCDRSLPADPQGRPDCP